MRDGYNCSRRTGSVTFRKTLAIMEDMNIVKVDEGAGPSRNDDEPQCKKLKKKEREEWEPAQNPRAIGWHFYFVIVPGLWFNTMARCRAGRTGYLRSKMWGYYSTTEGNKALETTWKNPHKEPARGKQCYFCFVFFELMKCFVYPLHVNFSGRVLPDLRLMSN